MEANDVPWAVVKDPHSRCVRDTTSSTAIDLSEFNIYFLLILRKHKV